MRRFLELIQKYKTLIMLVIILFLAFDIVYLNRKSFYNVLSAREQNNILIKQNKELEIANSELKKINDKLSSDISALEKVAREKYGMGKEGETVIQFLQDELE